MKQAIEKRKDVAFFIKLFPLRMHKDAYRKSKAIQCENLKDSAKAMRLLEDVFEKKQIPDPVCETDVIDSNIKLAEEFGITGTPTIILRDGRVISGALKAEQILEYIDGKRQ